MRLLLDESLSARIAPLLSQAGHDVVHATDVDLLGEPDEVVLSAAAAEGRTLVTADTDFGTLLALSRAPAASVLLFRGGGRHVEQRAEQILVASSTPGRAGVGRSSWPNMTSCVSATCRSNPIADGQYLLKLPEPGVHLGPQSPGATGIVSGLHRIAGESEGPYQPLSEGCGSRTRLGEQPPM